MNQLTDQELLREYAERRSEAAFAELVRRHVDLIYSAALRMVCDSHLAEDVTQGAFVALARSASQLTERAVLSGWLHRTAQNIAAQTVRTDVRRRIREQEAAAMNELLANESDVAWEHIAPHLDAALGALSEPERDVLLLRYFERKSAQEMARVLGISEEAAQKRVSRAVERLREFFAKRGVTVGASGLIVVISANAVQAAPNGLALTISSAAVAGTTLATAATITAGIAFSIATLAKILLVVVVITGVGIGIYQAIQPSRIELAAQSHSSNSLADDALTFVSNAGRWESEILTLKLRSGTVSEERLVIEFGAATPAGQSNSPDAQAKLSAQTIPSGPLQANSSLGDASFRNVRLTETVGVRTMTISSAKLEKQDPRQTLRELERYKKLTGGWVIMFPYGLTNKQLTLKGFSTTNSIVWGVAEFTVPKSEITFTRVP